MFCVLHFPRYRVSSVIYSARQIQIVIFNLLGKRRNLGGKAGRRYKCIGDYALGSLTSEAREFPRRRRLSKFCFAASSGISGYRGTSRNISRARGTIRRCAGWSISRACVPMGTLREKRAARHPRACGVAGANPCDKEGPKLLNTLGKGSVLRLYLVTVSSRAHTCRIGVATDERTVVWSIASSEKLRSSKRQRSLTGPLAGSCIAYGFGIIYRDDICNTG